jgi:BlaI family transcriptional regulator, penicillinase repressor
MIDMARSPSESLTERESQIMDVVWNLGEATAEQVREALPGAPHDSTVRTILRVMEAKGYLTHEARGKAYFYTAAVARQKAQRLALRSVLTRFFAGSAEKLVLRLIEDEHLTAEQLEELKQSAPPTAGPKRRRKGGAS